MKTIAILLAAGDGKRFLSDKILHLLNGKSLIEYSLNTLNKSESINEIIIVTNKNNKEKIAKISKRYSKVKHVTIGSKTRFLSSLNGFSKAELKNDNLVLFHNAANPFVTEKEISDCIESAKKYKAAGVAHKATNTIRRSDAKSQIIPRENIYLMETPQVLKAEIFKKGSAIAKEKNVHPTDDLALAELVNITPKIVEADKKNKKITYQNDLDIFLPKAFSSLNRLISENFAVGIGHDSHRFSDNGKCVLGGIEFTDCAKLEGNSDGDAALHALTNALLSSLGEGSLSTFADEMCKNGITNSKEYLKVALEKLKEKNGEIKNCSLSFECLRPKLEKYFPKMKEELSKILNLNSEKIGLTATSGEKLTSFGKGNGVQVFASVLIKFKK